MLGIVIYTKPDVLLHKQGKLKNDPDHSSLGLYYWRLEREIKRVAELERIYFATEGFIRGYFLLQSYGDFEFEFHVSTWRDIEPIPQKPFQGFKYFTGVA